MNDSIGLCNDRKLKRCMAACWAIIAVVGIVGLALPEPMPGTGTKTFGQAMQNGLIAVRIFMLLPVVIGTVPVIKYLKMLHAINLDAPGWTDTRKTSIRARIHSVYCMIAAGLVGVVFWGINPYRGNPSIWPILLQADSYSHLTRALMLPWCINDHDVKMYKQLERAMTAASVIAWIATIVIRAVQFAGVIGYYTAHRTYLYVLMLNALSVVPTSMLAANMLVEHVKANNLTKADSLWHQAQVAKRFVEGVAPAIFVWTPTAAVFAAAPLSSMSSTGWFVGFVVISMPPVIGQTKLYELLAVSHKLAAMPKKKQEDVRKASAAADRDSALRGSSPRGSVDVTKQLTDLEAAQEPE